MSTSFSYKRSLNAKNNAFNRIATNKPVLMLSKKHLNNIYHELRTTSGTTSSPDGVSFSSLSERDWEIRISKLAKSIKNESYKPGPTKPVNITKLDGGIRTIQVSNHIDKIPQRACLKALTPSMESRFVDWSYGFRPNRSHTMIFEKIADGYRNGLVYACHYDVVKAFDTVRVSSLRRLLSQLPGVEPEVMGLTKTLLLGTKPDRLIGLNQGEALSGLLFNFYVNEFHDVKMDKEISEEVQIYRYADDLCVIGKSKDLVEQTVTKSINYLNEANLEVVKKEVVDLRSNKIDLLGLTLKGNESNIDFSLPNSTWKKLSLSLDEAHKDPNPIHQIKRIVSGWKQASHPMTWTVQDDKRLESILRNHGITMNNLEDNNHE